jgi:hypothetical protein
VHTPPARPLDPAAAPVACDPAAEALRGPRVWRLTERQLARTIQDATAALTQGRLRQVDQVFQLDDGGPDAFHRTAATLQLTGAPAEQLVEGALAYADRYAAMLAAPQACLKAPTLTPECAGAVVTALYTSFARRQAPDDAMADARAFLMNSATALGRDEAVKLLIAAVLGSPYTLFRWEQGLTEATHRGQRVRALNHVEMASALSFTLANRPPPAALIDELARVDLGDAATVERLARQHFVATKDAEAVRAFLKEMFGMKAINPQNANDPAFTQAVADRLSADADAWIDDVVGRAPASLGSLLTTDAVFASAETAFVYGLPRAGLAAAPIRATPPAPGQRAGVFTQPGFLAAHAFAGLGDPVHRGKVIRENLFCATLPPPPPEAANIMVPTDPRLSNRERFMAHGQRPECAVCHKLIDDIGFAFEKYDGAGRFKTQYPNRAVIDDRGSVNGTDVDGPIAGPAGLTERLLESKQVDRCVSSHLFRFAVGDVPRAQDVCTLQALQAGFDETTDLVHGLVAALVSPSFRFRK